MQQSRIGNYIITLSGDQITIATPNKSTGCDDTLKVIDVKLNSDKTDLQQFKAVVSRVTIAYGKEIAKMRKKIEG